MIKQEVINEIKNKSDIVDVVGSYIPLIKKGKNFFGVCPFHDDTNPSMSVSSEKQIYTCFSCGATGNVINFVMDYEKIPYVEALKLLADKSSIHLDVKGYEKPKNEYDDLYKIYDVSNMFYINNLNSEYGKEALKYLNNRNITNEIIKEFKIGLALKDKNKLTELLKTKGFKEEDLINIGLSNRSDYGIYDLFSNRIMFPLHNEKGNIVGYSGRIYDNSSDNKYLNTKETVIFKKGLTLYNYHRAKEYVREEKSLIIVEGFMDVIRLYSVGIKNVVALMGTAFTKEQASLVRKLSDNVYLSFDGDDAGYKATIAAINSLGNINPKIIMLKDNEDPDTYVLNNKKEGYISLLNNAISPIEFKMEYLKRGVNLNNPVELTKYIKEITNDLSNIKDPLLYEVTLNKISTSVGVSYNTLLSIIKKEEVKIEKKVIKLEEKLTKYEKAEKLFLFFMLKDENIIIKYKNKLPYLPTQNCRFLLQEIIYFYEKYKTINISDFISFLEDKKELINEIGKIEMINYGTEYDINQVDDFYKVLNEYPIKKEIERLIELQKSESDPNSKVKIGVKITELKMRSEVND